MNSKTLFFSGYYITGLSDLSLWGGGNACIEMKPFRVKHIKEIPDNLNDSDFGVESINGAIVDIYREYGNSHREYARTITVGKISDNTANTYLSC